MFEKAVFCDGMPGSKRSYIVDRQGSFIISAIRSIDTLGEVDRSGSYLHPMGSDVCSNSASESIQVVLSMVLSSSLAFTGECFVAGSGVGAMLVVLALIKLECIAILCPFDRMPFCYCLLP